MSTRDVPDPSTPRAALPPRLRAALDRWLAVIHTRGDAAAMAAALAPGAVIRTHVPGDPQVLDKQLEGAELEAWVRRTPVGTVFRPVEETLRGDAAAGTMELRYAFDVRDEFSNGGAWRIELDAEDRIAAIDHFPDPLPAKYAPPPPPKWPPDDVE